MIRHSAFLSTLILGGIAFSGCVMKEVKVDSSTKTYLKEKINSTGKGSIEEYIQSNKDKENTDIIIHKGDKVSKILKEILEDTAQIDKNFRYIYEPSDKDYAFKKNLRFKNIEHLIEYVNFSDSLPIKIEIKRKDDIKKYIVVFNSEIEETLKKNHYENFGNVNVLNEVKDIIGNASASFDIDQYSAMILSETKASVYKGDSYSYIKSLADSNNLYFEAKENTVKINQFHEKVFDITITPLSIQSQATSDLKNTATNSNGQTKEGATGQASQVGFGYKIYDELKESVSTIIGKEGMFHLNQASGQLITRARPQNMKLIEEVVKKFNEMYSLQLEIELEIMEVSLNENHQNGIDFTLTGKDTTFSSAFKPLAASSNFVSIATDFTKRGTRVQNMIQMLNTFGTVEMSSKPTLKTLNSVPGVISIGLDKDYISDVTITPSTTTSAASYDIKRDTATDGIKLYVYPRVIGEDKILLTIQPQTSTVLGLEEHNVGGLVTIQTKTMNNREFSNTMTIKNGETTLLAGFLTQYKSGSKYGMPWIDEKDSKSDYIGGMRSSEKRKTELVLAITARIIK